MNTDINHLPPILSFHGEGIPKCGRRWRMMSLSRCKCPVSLRGRSTSSHSAAEGKYGPSVMRSFVQQDQPPVAWWFGLIVWRLQVRSPLVHRTPGVPFPKPQIQNPWLSSQNYQHEGHGMSWIDFGGHQLQAASIQAHCPWAPIHTDPRTSGSHDVLFFQVLD